MELQKKDKITMNLKVGSKKDLTIENPVVTPGSKKHKRKGLPVTEEFMDLLHQVKQIEEIKVIKHQTTNTWKEWVLYHWNDGFLKPLTIWCIWLFVGTMYFANVDFGGNYYLGFYYSISVGYCVGWGVLTPKYRYTKIFAMFFLFVGALFVLHYVTVLIQLAVAENDNTYEQLKIKKNIERSCTLTGWKGKVYVYLAMHNEKLFIIYVWVLMILLGAFVTVAVDGWTWLDGFYFSVTTMATAGLYGIPKDSPNFLFLLVGLFTAVGVPTMAMAVSNIGLLIMEARAEARVEAIINQEVQITRNELVDILKLKEHNNKLFHKNKCVSCTNGATVPTTPEGSRAASPPSTAESTSGTAGSLEAITIDRNEFLIVSLIRMKIIDIELIHDVLTKFDRVDAGGDGHLTLQMVKSSSKAAHANTTMDATNAAAAAALENQPYIVREFSNRVEVASTDKALSDAASEVDGAVSTSGTLIKDGYQYLEDV